MKKTFSPAYSLKFKNIILFFNQGLIFFSNGHIRNVVSTLRKRRWKLHCCFNVVQRLNFNVDMHNVVSTATSYLPKHNVEPTLKCLLGELIAEILSFLQIFSVRKTTTQFLQYFRNSDRYQQKKLYFWHILGD